MSDDQRTRILKALARGDGQIMAGFDFGHTAEMMYGKQADAVELLIAQEVKAFASEIASDLRDDADLSRDMAGARHIRAGLTMAAKDIQRAASARFRKAQARYDQTSLAKPLQPTSKDVDHD